MDTPEALAMLDTLDALDARLIDRLQGGFPLVSRPYAAAGRSLGLGEDGLIRRLRQLLQTGVLSRFGPMYQIERLGGRFVLAALAAPEARFDDVAAAVNALPAVAHNYRREHRLNMWFVLAADSAAAIDAARRGIELVTGLEVNLFPKEREYFVGMRFQVGGAAPVGAAAGARRAGAPAALSEDDRLLIRATQAGLPLCRYPYRDIARRLGWAEAEVTAKLARWLEQGVVRRIGAVPNHYAIGYRANGMAVFDVADEQVDALGAQLGGLDAVSHCYRRPRRPGWPYNLFAMLHGSERPAVLAAVDDARALLGEACHSHEVLFSSRILKKTGLRL
ncbi:siroheme decarboxylase subunit beta [Chromobacterium haemolyticum]|uniref:siroheme decarboxylase subunit beta n=1 Tax=Chromobacterium haemolyticum TaxID=394935 RepID=UPI0020CB6026|nr:Lrp/AsnC family transcriptional regulator [Chromobacterium haemolyticum]